MQARSLLLLRRSLLLFSRSLLLPGRSLTLYPNTEQRFEVLRKGQVAGALYLLFSRRAVPKGAFAGLLHVTLVRVDGVSETTGMFDRADLYCRISLGGEERRTSTKDNSGGSNVIFDEVLTLNKALMQGKLCVEVQRTLSIEDTFYIQLTLNKALMQGRLCVECCEILKKAWMVTFIW